MIHLYRHETVTVVELAHGRVNTLDIELLDELTTNLNELATRTDVAAIVLTGSGKVFSAGVDLPRLLAEDVSYVRRLISGLHTTFENVFTFPKPTVAAVNGAAIAGGCVIACACDLRIAADTIRIGANELGVGVALPAMAIEVLRQACGNKADEVIFSAQVFDPQRAQELGIIHQAVPSNELIDRAVSVATTLGQFDPDAYRLAKESLRAPALDQIRSAAVNALVTQQWERPGTRARLKDLMDKLRAQ